MEWWYTTFIILHTSAAVVCLLSGLYVVWPQLAKARPWVFPIFFWSLIGLAVFVTAALLSHWTVISSGQLLTFSGLVVLAIYMIYRGIRARNNFRTGNLGDSYINDVGFILISLFVGLIIVPLLRLNAPTWLALLSIALVIFAGARFLKFISTKNKL